MAYINQEIKKKLAPAIKAVMKEYGVKGTIAIQNYSTLVVNIKEGALDFGVEERGYTQIHHANGSNFSGKTKEFVNKIFSAMMGDVWYDNSDSMTDYFDTAYYMRVNVGDYGKNYKLVD